MQQSGELFAPALHAELPALSHFIRASDREGGCRAEEPVEGRRTTIARERTRAVTRPGSRCRVMLWGALLGLVTLLASAVPALAHDLAIDQVLLSPRADGAGAGTLRGELTFDPELTRPQDAVPTADAAARVIEFLRANLSLTRDGQPLPVEYEVRELWVRGGATVGDVVVFSAPLAPGSRELRLFASRAFKALVVSVQEANAAGRMVTASWLLTGDSGTPAYRLGVGWQEAGWREGGPDVFLDALGVDPAGAASGDTVAAGTAAEGTRLPARAERSLEAQRPAPVGSLAARFVQLGFEHILPGGIDHVLFVAGLVLGSAGRYRRVLISLSLFTLAHTLTLALGSFHVLSVSPRFVEPVIALSIFLLGVDNLRPRAARLEGSERLRYAVVFGFGLVHGLGFAGALSELAFERDSALVALLSFNVGVELGQVAVVALLGLSLHLIRRQQPLSRYATVAGSLVIAASGVFLVFERLGRFADPSSLHVRTQSDRHDA